MQHHHGNHVKYEWQSSWCGNDKLLLREILGADLTHTSSLDQSLVDEEAPVSYTHKTTYYNSVFYRGYCKDCLPDLIKCGMMYYCF